MQQSIASGATIGFHPFGKSGYEHVDSQFFQGNQYPYVIAVIRHGRDVLALPSKDGNILPMVEIHWEENYLAGIHRAFMGPLSFRKRNGIPRGKSLVGWQMMDSTTERRLPIFVETYDLLTRPVLDVEHTWLSLPRPVHTAGYENMSDELLRLVQTSFEHGPFDGVYDQGIATGPVSMEIRV